ncbi:MAG: HVO_0476 family zinc finger protein [Haloarculaceae archaeon]
MSEPTERVAAACPACSPDEPIAHELLKPGGRATVRCSDCGHVHKVELESETTVERRVIVSQDGDSFEAYGAMDPDERVVAGEEFLLETDEAIFTVRVTDLELVDGGRSKAADAEEIRTVWSRAVGNVSVDLTLHARDDRQGGSRSLKIQVPGDEEFVVGETHEYGDEAFTVESVIVREAAFGDYPFEHLKHDGDAVLAKDVKRLYARDENATAAWSAW